MISEADPTLWLKPANLILVKELAPVPDLTQLTGKTVLQLYNFIPSLWLADHWIYCTGNWCLQDKIFKVLLLLIWSWMKMGHLMLCYDLLVRSKFKHFYVFGCCRLQSWTQKPRKGFTGVRTTAGHQSLCSSPNQMESQRTMVRILCDVHSACTILYISLGKNSQEYLAQKIRPLWLITSLMMRQYVTFLGRGWPDNLQGSDVTLFCTLTISLSFSICRCGSRDSCQPRPAWFHRGSWWPNF